MRIYYFRHSPHNLAQYFGQGNASIYKQGYMMRFIDYQLWVSPELHLIGVF